MVVLETRARGEVSRLSSNDSREPLDRLIAPNASVRRYDPVQRAALSESAGLATPHPLFLDRRRPLRNREGAGGTDAPPGASSGGKLGCDERLRSEQTGFRPVVGDRQIAGRSAVHLQHCRIKESICVICVICGQIAIVRWLGTLLVSSCLRVCDVCDGSVSDLCVSVPLWFS